MEQKTSIKHKTADLVVRCLRMDTKYCLSIAPFIPIISDYYETLAGKELSAPQQDTLRKNVYQATLPELKTAFEEMIREWEGRLDGEPWQQDLGARNIAAVEVAALIHFLRSI